MTTTLTDDDDPRLGPLIELWYDRRESGRPIDPDSLGVPVDLRVEFERAVAGIVAVEAALGGATPPPPPPRGVPERFEGLAYHAEGGMGVVYKAWDAKLGRYVAYKIIKSALVGDRDRVAAFTREAEITARLQHTGVVPIYALEQDATGPPAYAMKFIDGRDLKEVVASFHEPAGSRGRTDWLPLIASFVAACRTVQHAHEQGVLHRDLAPRNILIAGDETFVVDWGLATRPDDETSPGPESTDDSRPPTRAGTASYVAPEVWDESIPHPFGPRSDVFALGALLYLILTGRPPFEGQTTHEIIQQAMTTSPPDPRTIRPDCPRPLAAICVKAMTRRPEDRYSTAKAMADEAASWLVGDRVAADREPWFETSTRWALRHAVAVAASIVGVVVLASSAVTWASLTQADTASREIALRDREAELARTARNQINIAGTNFGSSRLNVADRETWEMVHSFLALLESEEFDRGKAIATIKALFGPLEANHPANPPQLEMDRVREPLLNAVGIIEEMIRLHPTKPEYRRSLAETYYLLGHFESRTGLGDEQKQAAALAWHDKAIALLEPLIVDPQGRQANIGLVGDVENLRHVELLGLKRFTETLIAADRAGTFIPGFGKSLSLEARDVLSQRAEMEQARLPWSRPPLVDHAHAIAMADYLANRKGVSDKAIYNAACAFSLASLDDKADAAERERRAVHAVALLARIGKAGYFADPNWRRELKDDADFAAIRDRQDFQEMARPYLP